MELFLIYIFKSSGVLLLFYATYKLFLQRETFFNANRAFLVLGLILSLVIPVIEFTKIIYVEALQFGNTPFRINNPLENILENEVDWSFIVMVIYSLGVLFFSLRFSIQLLSLYKLISKGDLHKKNGYKYVKTNENTSPFSFFNYIVYNPEKHTEGELKTIIEHEKIHSSQKHSADIIGAQLLSIFQWINPIAWLYKKAIAQNLEYLADNASIKKLQSTKDYQYLLLKQSSSNYNLSITNTFFNLLIKKRIVMLNKNKSQKQNAWKYGLILPLLAIFIFSFNVKTIAQTTEVKENIKISNELHIIGNPIYILNGKKISKEKFKSIMKEEVEAVNVLKDEKAFEKYGEKAKNGVVEITTKNILKKIDHDKNHLNIYTSGEKPIYILNDKKISTKEFEALKSEKIESINVLKGEKAIKKYGKEAKDGVVEITTKK